jgi:GTP-binding protein
MSVFIVSITVGVNTSPLAGTEGKRLTSQMIRDRLYREEQSNDTTIKVNDTDSAEMFDVYGLSEKQLIALIEAMRREGFELTVSDFQCIFRRDENDENKLLEPYEEVVIDAPLDYSGSVIEELNRRCGSIIELTEFDTEVHIVFHVPTRLLLGFKEDFTNITRGFGVFNRTFLKYDEVANEILSVDERRGFLISSETGEAVAYALSKLQDRGIFHIMPQDNVYTGMIVGENSRNEDMEINVLKGKALTNMRASGSDEAYNLTPPKMMNLECMMGYLTPDECIEVTPFSLRMRKKILDSTARKSFARSQRTGRHFKILEDNS